MKEPLTGVKVLDLSRLLPGPYCTLLLADLGADVIKIEEPYKGDYMRKLIPGVYEAVNRNKRSMTLDLKRKEGREVLFKMAENADVMVEGFRPTVTTRIGIDYPTIKKLNNSIIYCSISGYGQDGPYRDRPGHDINYLGIAGALSIPGEVNKKPTRPGLPIVDLGSGLFAAFSILAAIMLREKTGKGQYVDVAMTDGMISWMSVRAGEFLLGRNVQRKPSEMDHLSPANAVFQTKDKRKITLGAIEDNFWIKLCNALDLKDIQESHEYSNNAQRVKRGRKLYRRIQEVLLTKERDEWIEILDKAGVPCSPVYYFNETFEDPHVKQRGLFTEIPYRGTQKLKQVRFPIKFSDYKPKIHSHPPEMGEHTEDILLEEGLTINEVKDLRENGVI